MQCKGFSCFPVRYPAGRITLFRVSAGERVHDVASNKEGKGHRPITPYLRFSSSAKACGSANALYFFRRRTICE